MSTLLPAIMEYVHKQYLTEYEEVLTRRAIQFQKLSEKDPFSMTEEEQSKHQALLNKLANELLIMDKMRWLATEYQALETRLQIQSRQNFNWARDQFELLAREAVFWKQQYLEQREEEEQYIEIIERLIQQLKHHTTGNDSTRQHS
jgi:hypothetical protein